MAGVPPSRRGAPITRTPYKPMYVTSHRWGTVVLLRRPKRKTCISRMPNGMTLYASSSTRYKAFFDANNNGRLDVRDRMLTSGLFCESCPPRSWRRSIGEGLIYCIQSVTARDIRIFRAMVGREFAKARRLRRAITPGMIRRVGRRNRPATVRIGSRRYSMQAVCGNRAQSGLGGVLTTFGLHNRLMKADVVLSECRSARLWICQKNYGFLDL